MVRRISFETLHDSKHINLDSNFIVNQTELLYKSTYNKLEDQNFTVQQFIEKAAKLAEDHTFVMTGAVIDLIYYTTN